jgi:hypothetical protein
LKQDVKEKLLTGETVRFEPYTVGGEVRGPQLEFVKRHIALLSPGFRVPEADWRTGTARHLGDGDYLTVWEFGSGQGYRVTLNETLESRASGVAARSITVEAFGLPEGRTLWSRYESSFSHPPYIELRVSGPEDMVALIARRFREEFGPARGVEGGASGRSR